MMFRGETLSRVEGPVKARVEIIPVRAVRERLLHAMAEREGFEPPIPVKVCLISSQVHSTGLCHLSALAVA